MKTLTIHIIVIDKDKWTEKQSFFVALDNTKHIRQFRRILSEQSNERAMMYALARGREVDPVKIKSAAHLILTKDGAYWDLMG
jgi:hypothetical protein